MIKNGLLSDYMTDAVVKRLSAVETDPGTSNQHEFNGVAAFQRAFGPLRTTFTSTFVFLSEVAETETDDGTALLGESADGAMTWYDAREKHPTRTEFRFYFSTGFIQQVAVPGDILVVAKRPDESLLVIVARQGTTAERQLLWLLGVSTLVEKQCVYRGQQELERPIGAGETLVLRAVGVEVTESDDSFLDALIGEFGNSFPKTDLFSAFARASLPDVDAAADPDAAILAWWEREELLFRTLERHIVAEQLRSGFDGDVDRFVDFSLAVQNRRKSRAGWALEHHVEQALKVAGVRYVRGARTENKSRPDFLFPSIDDYRDENFPTDKLTMLAAKSTCKDRWRQVLTEAERISEKHLVTLEPGISDDQTMEMKAHDLQLVVPTRIHQTYSQSQRPWLMQFADFVTLVRSRQAH